MGKVLHGSARTTEAVRRAIESAQASIRALAERFGINPKTVVEWKKRSFAFDARMGPKQPRPTLLSKEEEAVCVMFRKHTRHPLTGLLRQSVYGRLAGYEDVNDAKRPSFNPMMGTDVKNLSQS